MREDNVGDKAPTIDTVKALGMVNPRHCSSLMIAQPDGNRTCPVTGRSQNINSTSFHTPSAHMMKNANAGRAMQPKRMPSSGSSPSSASRARNSASSSSRDFLGTQTGLPAGHPRCSAKNNWPVRLPLDNFTPLLDWRPLHRQRGYMSPHAAERRVTRVRAASQPKQNHRSRQLHHDGGMAGCHAEPTLEHY